MSEPLRVLILHNQPALAADDADYASEAGVLEAVNGVREALLAGGHELEILGLPESIEPLIQRVRDGDPPNVVVNLCEGLGGQARGEPLVAAALEMLQLAYTGSPPESLALARDKVRTKWLLKGAGIPTPEFVQVGRDGPLPATSLEQLIRLGPVIVKPAAEDASLGISPDSVAGEMPAVLEQIAAIRARYGEVLVERFITGREFNVGIVALPRPQVLPLAEIDFEPDPENRWGIVTYDAKWTPASRGYQATPVVCPAKVDVPLADRIRERALVAFRLIGCRDYARVDFRVDQSGEPFVLEVNANPDISTATAGLARQIKAAGIAYEQFVEQLVTAARARHEASRLRPGRTFGPAPRKTQTHPESPKTPIAGKVEVHPGVRTDQINSLVEIIVACKMFRDDEVDVAREILDEAAAKGPAGDYQILIASIGDRPVGWSCHGLIPITDGAYDLFWIAVHPDVQGIGVGKRLLLEVERLVHEAGGRWVLAETSSLPTYENTRAFYRANRYHQVGLVPDFYRVRDGRVTFGKRLRSN